MKNRNKKYSPRYYHYTSEQLIELLWLISKIEDNNLRLRISSELMGGN